MRRTFIIVLLTLIAFIIPTHVLADSTAIIATKDAAIDSEYVNTNYGNVRSSNLGTSLESGVYMRGLIEFSLSSLPTGFVIVSATFSIYYHSYPHNDPVGKTILAQRLRRTNWEEYEATWREYRLGSYWSTSGASNAAYDYAITDQSAATVPSSPGWINWDVTNQVKWAQSNSATVDIKLRFDDEITTGYMTRFYMREEDGYEPKLVIEYYPPSIPLVTTGTADVVTSTSVVCHGTVTNTGGATITKRGIKYGLTQTDTWDSYETGSFGVGDFSKTLSGLQPNTAYWFRVYATSSAGTGHGAWNSFTTTANAPTVTTQSASSITGNSALLNGVITSTGGMAATVRGFKYGLTKTDRWSSYETGDFDSGAYSLSASGLIPGTPYWFRAYATNGMGTSYGSWVSFKTVGLPTVTTNDATYVSSTSARLNGRLSSSGGEACEYRFQYGYSTGAYGFETSWSDNITSGQSFHADVSRLTSDTPYYFRTQARNSAGVANGVEKSFTTAWELLPPSQFSARATSGADISLLWVAGGGSDNTLIMMKMGSYPTSTADGTQVYFGQSPSVSVPNLTPGTTYYFSAWGESSGDYSSDCAQALTTTLAGSLVITPVTPDTPSGWFQVPTDARITGMPLYAQISDGFVSYGLPRATGWLLLALFLSALMGILALSFYPKDFGGGASSGAVYAALLASAFFIVLGRWMGVIPFWVFLPLIIIEGSYAFVRSRA